MRSQPPITKHDDEIDRLTRPPPVQSASRKKGTGVRAWLLLDSAGEAQVVEAEKHVIMRRTGLPARDLRILDPQLSYPSTILGRERAIVVNLEQIKAVITAEEVLMLNSGDPMVTPVVEELQRRLVFHYNATKAQEDDAEVLQPRGSDNELPADVSHFQGLDEQGMVDRKPSLEHRDGPNVLPFEFVALEAFLEATCSSLEKETKTLEQEAHPALDKLTSKISTLNLDRVRQLKSRLVALTGRVQKVRDELEHLLDDDEDMAEMYLTEKQQLENSSTSSLNGRAEMSDEYLQGDFADGIPTEVSLDHDKASSSFDFEMQNADNSKDYDSHRTHTTTRSSISNKLDVEELEMLLEAYFVQIEGTLNKLSTLREYVDDTEDYINIMLDDKQNHLLQMGVMLTTATLVISSFIVVAGIFGMNINIKIFNEEVETAMPKFLWTVGGSSIGCVIFYVFAIAWYKKKRLID